MSETYYQKLALEGILFHLCPNCEMLYIPEYENKENAPEETIYKEQHIIGICSDNCWDEFLGYDCFFKKGPLEELLEYFPVDDTED